MRDFPEAMLDSEINACFLSNEPGDPHFLMQNFKVIYNMPRFEEKFKILLQSILILMLYTAIKSIPVVQKLAQ